MKLTTISLFSVFLAVAAIGQTHTADNNERSFENGFAARGYGNVYNVDSSTTDGSNQDRDIDNSDGPYKGDIIGLTAAEKDSGKTKILYIPKSRKGNAGSEEPLTPKQ